MSAHSSHLPPTGPVPGFHSQVPYEIQPEDRDAILRTSAFHCKDTDRLFIWFPAGAHTDILTSTLPINSTSAATLGELDRLPLELINKICLEMNMASLFRFRQVNTRARQTVDVLHEYRIITTHAMNAFCALMRSGATPNVTLLEFYRLLCTQTCSLCESRYGNLVHLLLWIRCCERCLVKSSTKIQSSTLNSVKRVLGLSKPSLAELPRLTTLPGIYTYEEIPRIMRMAVVSTASALEAYRLEHSGVEASEDLIEKLNTQWIFLFMVCCAFPSFDLRTRQAQNGVSCAGCELAFQKEIITTNEGWEREMYCGIYSHDGFLEHFKHCEQAQLLWVSSNGGTRQAPELPHLCQVGGSWGGSLRDDE